MSNSLRVPDAGLRLHGPSDSVVPQQAFALSLSDNVISGMLDCIRDGGKINLSLGATPTFRYGDKTHKIMPPVRTTMPYDMYLTQPFESSKTADRIPYAGNLFSRPEGLDATAIAKSKAKIAGGSSSGVDSDAEALRDQLAARDAARERSVLVSGLGKSNKASGKLGRKYLGDRNASLPTSPAMKPAPSPILSASEQAMSKAKQLRLVMVHELAIEDRTSAYLREKWTGNEADFKLTLEKIAIRDETSKKWTMRKTYFKELDVWQYNYSSQEERQKVIDNAIRRFDNMRLSPSEPEWEKLLPETERGKGKCLSRLQYELSKGPKQNPMIQAQKNGDASTKDSADGQEKSKGKGEGALRSSSNPPPKAKKAQPKKLLGGKSKPTMNLKVSPIKPKPSTGKTNGRVLSQEIIENSDSSGDEGVVVETSQPTLKSAVAAPPKPTPRVVEKLQSKETAKKPAVKRPREDDSSSSSGTPLSKRVKQKTLVPGIKSQAEPRREALITQRDSVASPLPRSKNTSPAKSSPLASSPPTNASELSDSAPLPNKRKADMETKAPAPKRKAMEVNGETRAPAQAAKRKLTDGRPQLSTTSIAQKRRVAQVTNGGTRDSDKRKSIAIPREVLQKATKFKVIYQRYENRHHEIAGMDNPPQALLDDLYEMRQRLSNMKKDIYRRCAAVEA